MHSISPFSLNIPISFVLIRVVCFRKNDPKQMKWSEMGQDDPLYARIAGQKLNGQIYENCFAVARWTGPLKPRSRIGKLNWHKHNVDPTQSRIVCRPRRQTLSVIHLIYYWFILLFSVWVIFISFFYLFFSIYPLRTVPTRETRICIREHGCVTTPDVQCQDTSRYCTNVMSMGLCKLHRYQQKCCKSCRIKIFNNWTVSVAATAMETWTVRRRGNELIIIKLLIAC